MSTKKPFAVLTVCAAMLGCAPLDSDGDVGLVEAASICGPTNTYRDLEQAWLGKPADVQAMWRTLSLPVALLQTKTGWPYRTCTGFLVTDDILATERSCFASAGTGSGASSWQAVFDYQEDAWGTMRASQTFDVAAVLETSAPTLRFTIVRLAPRSDGTLPGEIYGTLPLEPTSSPAAPATVSIIQHPAGLPKQLGSGPVTTTVASTGFFSHRVDTQETTFLIGSLGAPILSIAASGISVVGMHQASGCAGLDPETGANSAASASLLYYNSPILRRLVGVRAQSATDIPSARVSLSTATQSCTRSGDWVAANLGCAIDPVIGQTVTVTCSSAQLGVRPTRVLAGAYGDRPLKNCTGSSRITCSTGIVYNGTGVSARCVFE